MLELKFENFKGSFRRSFKKCDDSGFTCTDRTEGSYDAETRVQISTAELCDMFIVV